MWKKIWPSLPVHEIEISHITNGVHIPSWLAGQMQQLYDRNFPVNWSATWDRGGCFDQAPTTSGVFPASEPETRALMNFMGLRPLEALISYTRIVAPFDGVITESVTVKWRTPSRERAAGGQADGTGDGHNTGKNCTGCHLQGLRAPSGTSSCWDCHGASAIDGKGVGATLKEILLLTLRDLQRELHDHLRPHSRR